MMGAFIWRKVFPGKRVTLPAESTLGSVYSRKKLTFLPESRAGRACYDHLALTELTRLGEPKCLIMVHTEVWKKHSRTFQGFFKDQNHFFQRLNFPTIWHKITRNTARNLCTAVLSNFLLCKTVPFNRGYFIQGLP